MKKVLALAGVLALVCTVSATFYFVKGTHAAPATATCTPTGFYRDSINMTAALINPTHPVKGNVDATGCNIGVYFGSGAHGNVTGANIYGANYFGVVNDGGRVNIVFSRIHDIGETPLNGTQHGVAIYFTFNSNASGDIVGNSIWNYQKGGIADNASFGKATIVANVVRGQGPVNYIAQNGIQIGYGADATVTDNVVTGNSYSGANSASSGGILVVGGDGYGGPLTTGTKITNNLVTGNDVGVYISQYEADFSYPSTPTNIRVTNNVITDSAISNTTGWGDGTAYQAGISDVGDHDALTANYICGAGYVYNPTPPPHIYAIDDTYTNNIVEHNNDICHSGHHDSSVTSNAASINAAAVNAGSGASARLMPSIYR